MGNIRIVGLGPSDGSDLTAKAIEAISDDSEKFLRTDRHDAVSYFRARSIPYTSYDYLYETMDDFDAIYRAIADDLLEKSKTRRISYFVPGHPMIAEKTVTYLLAADPEIEIVDGLSFLEPVLRLVGRDPVKGLKVVDGDDFSDLDLDVHTDTILTQVYNRRIVSEVKLALANLYGDTHEVYVLSHAGNPKKEFVERRPVYTLDRYDDYGHETSLYVPCTDRVNALRDLIELVRTLRGPEGCPWDRKQTHKTMKANLLEEAYEAAYAVECDDYAALEEELGDVLFQVVFHAELAASEGDFTLSDSIQRVVEKLVDRHPHVFGGEKCDWEDKKAEETGNYLLSQQLRHLVGLPALMRGQKIARRMKDTDFLAECIDQTDVDDESTELGLSLLRTVIAAEEKGIDAESALAEVLSKLTERVAAREGEGKNNL